MTNLEWIRTLSEEEFADWLYDEWLHHLQYRWSSSRGGLIIWLKDRKTENSSEKPNNCEDCIWTVCNYNKAFKDEPTISKMEQVDEPKTQTETQNSNLTFKKRTMRDCYNCKKYETEGECIECHYEAKDEPQSFKIIEAYAKGYKDGADAVKGIKDKQIRACDICKYEIGETCTHPKVKTMKKEWATFEGDLWGEENTPKWCPIDKDEPQTDGILFKGNLKEGDYKLIKTSNGWVLEGNDIAYYGEPQTERNSDAE